MAMQYNLVSSGYCLHTQPTSSSAMVAIASASTMENYSIKDATNNTSPLNITKQDQYMGIYTEDVVAEKLWQYVSPIIISVGVAGNVLSFLVMSRRQLDGLVISLCLKVLAVIDTLALLTGLLRQWIIAVFSVDPRATHLLVCKFHTFIVYWCLQVSAWIIVSITCERIISVFWPHIYKRYVNKKAAWVSLMFVFLLGLMADAHFFKTITVIHYLSEFKACYANENYEYFIAYTWPQIDIIIACLLPLTIIFLGNMAILYKLCHGQFRHLHTGIIRPTMTNLTSTFMAISVAFIITTLPARIFMSLQSTWVYSDDSQYLAKINLWKACVLLLMYVNNAGNFALFCLSSSRFRGVLKTIFHGNKVHHLP